MAASPLGNNPQLEALLALLAKGNSVSAAARPASSKLVLGDLGIRNTGPAPMTPEEAAALAMARPQAGGGEAAGGGVDALTSALKGLATPKDQGGNGFADWFKSVFKPDTTPRQAEMPQEYDTRPAPDATSQEGIFDPVKAAAMQRAGEIVLQENAAALPPVGPLPPELAPEVQGPPVPSPLDKFRQSNRDQFGMPGGLPPSGSSAPGTTAQATPPTALEAVAAAAGLPAHALEPGPQDSVVGTPPGRGLAERDQPMTPDQTPGSLPAAIWGLIPEDAPIKQLGKALGGIPVPGLPDFGQLAETWKKNAAGAQGSPPGQSAFSAGPFAKDNAPEAGGNKAAAGQTANAGPAPAFKYRFNQNPAGGVPANAMRDITIGPDGSVSSAAVPAGYINKMVGAESGGDPTAQNKNSSAGGLAQFTDGTWLDTVQQYDPETWRSLGGNKAKVLALKNDPQYHMTMANAFTNGNAEILQGGKLPVTEGNLYAMHFFGRNGGPKVLKASDDTPLEQIVPEAVKANGFLKGKTAGWARQWAEQTINKKGTGAVAGAYGMPGVPDYQSPQLPMPPMMQGPVPVDYSKMLEMMQQAMPKGQQPLSLKEKALNIIAGLASGAAAGRAGDWGSVLAGMGAGAARGAVGALAAERGMTKEDQAAMQAYYSQMAGVYGKTAESGAATTNAQRKTENENNLAIYERNVNQAKLDAQTRNKLNEVKYAIDWKAWEAGQPQVHATDNGISIVTRKPDGGVNIKSQSFKNFDKQWQQMKSMGEVLGKDNPQVQAMVYSQMAQTEGGDIFARRAMLNDLVERGGVQQALGADTYKQLEKEVDKAVPKTKMATDPKGYEKARNERMVDLLFQQMMAGNLPDTWIEQLAKSGHPGAMMLVQGAGS